MGSHRVREVSDADREALRTCMGDILRETAGQKGSVFGRALWEWQYLGPERRSIVVVAEDGDRLCGYYHVLVFGMRHRGRAAVAGMVQDVATLAAYRGQGVFRAMGGFALDRMRALGLDFVYTFPNDRSLPSFVRDHGYAVAARVPVYATPLDPGAVLASRLGLGAVGRALGALVGPLHRALRHRGTSAEAGDEVVRLTDADSELGTAAREFADRVAVGLDRTPRYLGWRFLQKPQGEYALWALRRRGRIAAYVVTRTAALFGTTCALVMDLGCRADEEAALLRLVDLRLGAERAAGAALGVAMGLHPFFGRLGALGFLRVPERLNPRPFNLVVKPLAPDASPDVEDPARWLVTLADWDVM